MPPKRKTAAKRSKRTEERLGKAAETVVEGLASPPLPILRKEPKGTPDPIEVWEENYARWLGTRLGRVSMDEEQEYASTLAGKPISVHSLRLAKRKLAFRVAYQDARTEVNELFIKQSRSNAIALVPKVMKVYHRAADALAREFTRLEADDKLDPLPAIRTAAQLAPPLLDRALPKKTEVNTTATNISITLSAHQQKHLAMPEHVVEAHEVIAEVIPNEDEA